MPFSSLSVCIYTIYVCVYTYLCISVCVCVYLYTPIHIYVCTDVCVYIYMCVCVYVTVHVSVDGCIQHIYIYIHTFVIMCVYICVYNTCACGTRRATWFTCYSSRSQDGISSPRSQGWCSTEGPKLRPAAKAATVPEAIVQGSRVLVEEDKGLG